MCTKDRLIKLNENAKINVKFGKTDFLRFKLIKEQTIIF